MGLIGGVVGGVIFTIIQALVFLFVLIATPLPMIRSDVNLGPFGRFKVCYTAWGRTTKCNGSKYAARGKAAFGCGQRRNNMNGAAAFAIISIVTTLVALIFGLLMIVQVKCLAAIPIFFTALSVATILISWACVAGVRTIKMCGNDVRPSYKLGNKYGAGFGLMVTAWCLEVINLIIVIVVSCF